MLMGLSAPHLKPLSLIGMVFNMLPLNWHVRDQLILDAINSLQPEKMLSHVTRCATSKDAWLTLETLFMSHSSRTNYASPLPIGYP